MRAIAALGVFISHVSATFPNQEHIEVRGAQWQLTKVLDWGSRGVSLFFVLSGFVLAWTWTAGTTKPVFLQRRFARVWPLHGVVWIGFMVAILLGMDGRPSVAAAALSLVLLQCWIPGAAFANAVNPVAWTLSCEAFFYLTFPFVIEPIRRMSARQLAGAAAVLAVGATAVSVVVLEPRGITVSTLPPYREWEFLMGVIAGVAIRKGMLSWAPPLLPAVAIGFASVAAVTWWHPLRGVAVITTSLAFLSIICRLALNDIIRDRPRLLHHRLAQRAGEVSYAFYLVQLLPLNALRHWWFTPGSWPASFLLIAVWFVLTVAMSWALHELVEKPAVKALRPRRREPVAVPAP